MVPLGDFHMLWGGISGGSLTDIEVANLELELLHTCFIGCDCGAFHTNGVLEDGFRGFYCDPIVRGVPMLQTKVVVLDVDVQVGEDQLLARPISTMKYVRERRNALLQVKVGWLM